MLELPESIMKILATMTDYHTGCIIFEAVDNLKIHNYLTLLDDGSRV